MKKMMQMAALALMVVLGSSLRNSISAQPYNDYDQDRDVSYQTFYDELSPHGRWVEYPGQGYVWVPDAGPDFQPYSTNGHWVWTDNYEWMWVSDYDWGWAPFHYGRWDHDQYYGWYWVPGYEWSPAWVAWRDGGDYYGWAPIRPGISININFNIGGYNPPYDFWVFAPRRYINSPRIYDYYVDRRRNVTIIHQTTIIINNYRYDRNYGFRSGPRRNDAEIYCGRINPVRFRQTYSPGRTSFRNNEVSVYRPGIRQENNRNVAPRNFERYDRNNAGNRNNGNNNGFRREDNTGNRDNAINNRRNDTRDRVSDDRIPRSNDNNRQPSTDVNNNRQTDRNRFDRNNNSVPDRKPADRRLERPQTNPGRTTDPGNRQPDNNRFERRTDDNPGRNRDMRTNDNRVQNQPKPQVERRQDTRPQPQVERRQDTRPQPQMERRQDTRPQPQVERRQEQQPRQQIERRQEQQPRQQIERRQEQQPRQQIERKDAGNNKGSGNGNGRGRSRN